MALISNRAAAPPRNPGPSWGFAFLRQADAVLPRPVFDFLLGAGTWIAVAAMREPRRNSRAYLEIVRGRPARLVEVWRHFFAFMQAMMLSLRVSRGEPYRCVGAPPMEPFQDLMASGRPALFGTFHLGHSDLLGFMLSGFNRHVHMIRLRVENSHDLERIARQLGGAVTFIWVNEPAAMLFALKEAVQSGASVAMKCDRLGHSAKTEAFDFLGARRLFPFTLYHLAILFGRPVMLSASVAHGPAASLVHNSPVFEPDGGSKESNLARARLHFQAFLVLVEGLLREDPYRWFNFLPLNPAVRA
jgi:predicted LPLAT superfamily acyltransferase